MAKSQEVYIGAIPLGGDNPVRIQSMTNVNTADGMATIQQIKRIADAGADYVRVTVRNLREAKNLELIKNKLLQAGYRVPLIADVHYNPQIAITAAQLVEKVRINPGNYIPPAEDYPGAIYPHLQPLIKTCKQYDTALRLGANHGSLSQRIIDQYGNTPEGMVQSILECLDVCDQEAFTKVIISLKSSNTRIMVQANRLMVHRMLEKKQYFPLHLGVTEAGAGSEGRIRSAVGIGTLLHEGIGDTIRVSLTEPPDQEIPFARTLLSACGSSSGKAKPFVMDDPNYNPFDYQKRTTQAITDIGNGYFPAVITDHPGMFESQKASNIPLSFLPDYYYIEPENGLSESHESPGFIPATDINGMTPQSASNVSAFVPLRSVDSFMEDSGEAHSEFVEVQGGCEEQIKKLKQFTANKSIGWVIRLEGTSLMSTKQKFIKALYDLNNPVIFKVEAANIDKDRLIASLAPILGSFFLDGIGDGVWITGRQTNDIEQLSHMAFGILQAARVRMTYADYISCPSCGRTLFDIESTVKAIKQKTAHLKGLKIAVMGCIVNGPGEMADADYGYIGSAPGKITLFKGKTPVKKNIPEKDAVEELVRLIKESGDWQEGADEAGESS